MKDHEEKRADDEREDVDFEPEEDLGGVAAVQAKIRKLREELERAKKERQEYLDGWQRCKADAVNEKREAAALQSRLAERVREEFAHDLIPVLDSFDMATGTPAWETLDSNWRAGMDQVRNQLLGVLHGHGIERFGAVGECFDPHRHEPLEERDDLPGEPGTIARIVRCGYASPGGVIRPAHVIVKKARHD